MSSEWYSEVDVSSLPAPTDYSEPVDTVSMRLLLAQLQHRLESRPTPLVTMHGASSTSYVYGEDVALVLGWSDSELPRMAARRLLWSGYLPVLDGGRLPRLYVEADVDVSATPAAGEEPAIGITLDVDGSMRSMPYPASTTLDSSGGWYIGRRISGPLSWQPSEPLTARVASSGGLPWVQAMVWLHSGQTLAASGSGAGPYILVRSVTVRAHGGDQ